MVNRSGPAVGALVTRAGGTGERMAAMGMPDSAYVKLSKSFTLALSLTGLVSALAGKQ